MPGELPPRPRTRAFLLHTASQDAATTWHWIDPIRGAAKAAEILKKGAPLALIWNVRLLEDPLQAAIEALLAPYTKRIPRHRDGAWRKSLEESPLFGQLEERSFPNEQTLDADALLDRIGSTSVVGALDDEERDSLLARARDLAADGPVLLRYRCEVQITARD